MRITNAHREKIVNALTQNVNESYKEQVNNLRQKAYDKARELIPLEILKGREDHPEFFSSTDNARAEDSHQNVSFPAGLYLPHPARHPDVPSIAGEINQADSDHRTLRRKVRAALKPFTTFKKLEEGWPEAAEALGNPHKDAAALVDLDQVNKIREMLKQDK